MALAAPLRPFPTGSAKPRIAPPLPAKTWREQFAAVGESAGITLRPWQRTAAHYLMGRSGDVWRYPHVAIVVGRQNGKAELLVPRIKGIAPLTRQRPKRMPCATRSSW